MTHKRFKMCICVVATLLGRPTWAAVDWHACVVHDKDQAKWPAPHTLLSGFNENNCTLLPDPNCSDKEAPGLHSGDRLVFWATDSTNGSAVSLVDGAGSFYLKVADEPEIELTTANVLPDVDQKSTYIIANIAKEKIKTASGRQVFEALPHGAPVRLTIIQGAAGSETRFEFKFIWRHPIAFYGIANNEIGLWLPLGLFSTNLNFTKDGIAIAAMPVGLAVGGKWYVRGSFYLGLSLFGNWLIAPGKTTQATSTSTYNLLGASGGILLDVDDYLYIGYAYGVDFRSGSINPGHLLVAGLAPGVLKWLQSRP